MLDVSNILAFARGVGGSSGGFTESVAVLDSRGRRAWLGSQPCLLEARRRSEPVGEAGADQADVDVGLGAANHN
jgi:hypothetical protein